MSEDVARNGYHPIQTAEDNASQSRRDEQENGEKGACPDADVLLPEEQCCCSALQRFVSPYLFGAFLCLTNFLQAAAFTATG